MTPYIQTQEEESGLTEEKDRSFEEALFKLKNEFVIRHVMKQMIEEN